MLFCVGFVACSDDDQTTAEYIASTGGPIAVEQYIDYKDGEIVRRGSYNGTSSQYLYEGKAYKYWSLYSDILGTWYASGNSIVVKYTDGRSDDTEVYTIEKVHLPLFVMRRNINSETVDYRLVLCMHDSDLYDDVDYDSDAILEEFGWKVW